MNLPLFLRRLHLYLGLALLPWLFLYGISSIPFAHNRYFQQRDEAKKLPLWTVRESRPFDRPVPADPVARRDFARQLLQEAGIRQPNFGTYQPNPNTLQIFAFSFLKSERVLYAIDRKTLTIEERRFRFDQFLTGWHARGGFEQDGWLAKSWGVVVDLVGAALILWVATGLYLWWCVRSARRWGLATLAAGVAAFGFFVARL